MKIIDIFKNFGGGLCCNGRFAAWALWLARAAFTALGMAALADPVWAASRPSVAAARAASSEIVGGGKIKTVGSYAKAFDEEPCNVEYWACMDTFCMMDNGDGARCACSNDGQKLDKEYNELVGSVDAELAKLTDVETEIDLGGDARIKRGGAGQADAAAKGPKEECDDDDISCKVGAAKLAAAQKICEPKVSQDCRDKLTFTKAQYNQNIRADCAAYQLAIKDAREKGMTTTTDARRRLLETAADKFDAENEMNESECQIALGKCMKGADICGEDWGRCAGRDLDDFKYRCETPVLSKCRVVADSVWAAFKVDVAPALTAAALADDGDRRQNCLSRVSDCVVKACRDDIAGKGVDTMDACLSRPEMAKSFCKVELDDCDAGGVLWTYVKQKLGAMRVDACTAEARACFEDDNACGKDFTGCVGLDMAAMRRTCPVDKLVACKQGKKDFALADIDNMIIGIYLLAEGNLEGKCKSILDEKIESVCGDVGGTCAKPFAGFDGSHFPKTMEWGLVEYYDGAKYAECKSRDPAGNCKEFPRAGELKIDEYVAKADAADREAARDALKSANDKIKAAIEQIESDVKVSWCANGRDMSQIEGAGMPASPPRYPNLTQGIRQTIASSALRAFAQSAEK